ncbi:hypothetical protein [Paenibacillus tengchongensis]|uniref:hypothetical protein n=1 Tax=Paenibacillus tengchongensis TaxID=2608684 RepID=UPI00124BF610|nr:hypothetical protein [Paenibacillus tengchongensis]
MRKLQLKIGLFVVSIMVLSGCTNSAPASTQESNSPAVTSKASPAASIVPTATSKYTNKNLGFSLELPASWENKYSIDENDTAVAFLHKESIGKSSAQGELFAIIRYPGKMTTEQAQQGAGVRSLVLSTDKYSYVLAYPSGVEYTDETKDDYIKMSEDIAAISKTVKTN